MYRIFDLTLDSDIPIPELDETGISKSSYTIRAWNPESFPGSEPEWFHDIYDANNNLSLSCGRVNNNYLLRFPELADFLVSLSEKSIVYKPSDDLPEVTIRHLLLDQVIPRVLGQTGKIILHASAVNTGNDRCIIFTGNTGVGKSTLVSSYVSLGDTLLTDDCLLLEITGDSIMAIPNYHGLRLYEDSATALFGDTVTDSEMAHYTRKKRMWLDEKSKILSESLPVAAIFVLEPNSNNDQTDIKVSRISGANELMTLIRQLFILDATDMKLIANQFKTINQIVSMPVNIYQLQFPHDFTQLGKVQEVIAATLGIDISH